MRQEAEAGGIPRIARPASLACAELSNEKEAASDEVEQEDRT